MRRPIEIDATNNINSYCNNIVWQVKISVHENPHSPNSLNDNITYLIGHAKKEETNDNLYSQSLETIGYL